MLKICMLKLVYSLLFKNKRGPTIKTGAPSALAVCNKMKTCSMIKFKSELCSLIPPSHLIKAPVTSYCETCSQAWKLKNNSKFPSVYMVMQEREWVNRHWESWIGLINFWHLYQLPSAFSVAWPPQQHLLLTPNSIIPFDQKLLSP